MKIKELEPPINSMRQNVIDSWLDGREETVFLIFSIYGVKGVKKYVKRLYLCAKTVKKL